MTLFYQIAHSLISLKIAHGFAGSFTSFPSQSFRALTSLQELDLSNNQLKTISDTSFHFLHNLRTVELNDNAIERISKGTFQVSILMIEQNKPTDHPLNRTKLFQCVSFFVFGLGGYSFETRNISAAFQQFEEN